MGKSRVIHPFLFAIIPVVFLYAHNMSQMSAGRVLLPAALSLALATFIFILFSLLLKNRAKAGLATSAFVLLFFGYGRLYGLLEERDIAVPGHGYLLPGVLLAFGYSVYFITRARSELWSVTRGLNIAAVALATINLFTLVSSGVAMARAPSNGSSAMERSARSVDSMPDIYFIVLDEYGQPDVIKEQYGYDNSRFIKSLEEKGFFVARDSQMHNAETIRAIASILNMEYTPETEPEEVTLGRITDNRVVDYLRSVGYRYVYLGQWYETGRYEVRADTYFNFYETDKYGPLTSEFTTLLWNTTMLRPFFNRVAGARYEGYYREGFIRTLDELKKVPEMEGPKFVYAHIMSPHAPFVFGPNGERVAPGDFYNFDDKQYYLGQYIYTSRQIDMALQEILDKSNAPIIIVQSDHGVRWLDGWERVLNAYYLPGDGKGLLYDSISPVNTFRLILDHYLGADYELLEDR